MKSLQLGEGCLERGGEGRRNGGEVDGPMITVMKHPGINGSALFGILTKRVVSVIGSAPNIAESEVCTSIS